MMNDSLKWFLKSSALCIAFVVAITFLVMLILPKSYPAAEATVTIDGAVGKLVGDIRRPAVKGGQVPTVIICHGLTGWRSEKHNMAVNESLLAHGYATVNFDFNGHGESDGPFSGMTIANELEDLHHIYDYVASLSWVDKKRIAVAGHSQGGFVAGVFAGDMGADRIKCAVLLAPAACIHVDAVNGFFFDEPIAIDEMGDSTFFWGRWFGKEYFKAARDIDVYSRTAAYEGPVLIVQGDADMPNLFKASREYPKYLHDCKYVEIPGLTHCYVENYALPAEATLKFIQENL